MNNRNNTLDRFNNEYLKCIVTTHASMINALKDKGALIIYQSKDNKNNDFLRNHIYLGNEFLASGYGFKTFDDLTNAENIINSYKTDNETINTNIANLENNYKDIEQRVNNKLDNFEPNIIVHDSNNNTINLDDVFFHGKPALYNDFEITNAQIVIQYFDGEYSNQFTNQYKTLVINNFNSSNVIDLPIGSQIKDINFILSYTKNDSNGISDLNITYYNSMENYNDDNMSVLTYSELQLNSVAEQGKLHLKLLFNNNFIVRSGNKIPIINSIQVNVKETPEHKYKKYPDLDFTDKKYVVYSLENMILEHSKIVLDSVYIRGVGCLSYLFSTYDFPKELTDEEIEALNNEENINNDEIENTEEILKNPYSLSHVKYVLELTNLKELDSDFNYERGIKYIKNTNFGDITDIYINVNDLTYNTFTFFISKSFDLYYAEYISTLSIDNWTGAIGLYKNDNDENVEYTTIPLNYNGLYTNQIYKLNTKVYQVKLLDEEKPMTTQGQIHLKLICKSYDFANNDIIYNITEDTGETENEDENENNQYEDPNLWTLLNNNDFDLIHWLQYNKYTDESILRGKLNIIKTNY